MTVNLGTVFQSPKLTDIVTTDALEFEEAKLKVLCGSDSRVQSDDPNNMNC